MNNIYKPTPEEIKTILNNHMHWWNEDCEGWKDMKADLSGADLRGADLRGANLSGANLRGANLRGANLRGADLSGANLRGANLRGADLSGANLIRADLRCADLSGADLSDADLSDADLRGANLRRVNLSGADLRDAEGIMMACPSNGAFVGWKKAVTDSKIAIVKLLIPEDAKRSSATGRKCRCDKAQVLAIFDDQGNELPEAFSYWNRKLIYRTGEIVIPDDFDNNRWNECSHGIHFFITRTEAENYIL